MYCLSERFIPDPTDKALGCYIAILTLLRSATNLADRHLAPPDIIVRPIRLNVVFLISSKMLLVAMKLHVQ